jgi:3-oxoacyl-[acyl-carrier-protein] synthase II
MSSASASAPRRVAITAAGIVSPLGAGLAENLAALQAGRDAIEGVRDFDVSRCRCQTAGSVPRQWLARRMREAAGAARHWHRSSHFVAAAVDEAREGDPGFTPELAVLATTSGGMSFGEDFFRAELRGERPRRRLGWLANYMPQKAVLDAMAAGGWRAPAQIVANACASGTNAVGHAFHLVRSGLQRTVLCGGFDAISELVFVGFDSLQAATSEKVRPFDRHRSGLALGEGAAVLCLEEMGSARRRGAPILAELTGYGIATDNHHLTQPHPSGIGPRRAMETALADARRRTDEVDYINAHGTATAFNDATEGLAIAQLFGKAAPVSSTKAMMGHSLGAAGAIEAVFSLLVLRAQFLPPNLHYTERDPAWEIDIVANEARAAKVRRVLSNSFGFGGTNASILLEAA